MTGQFTNSNPWGLTWQLGSAGSGWPNAASGPVLRHPSQVSGKRSGVALALINRTLTKWAPVKFERRLGSLLSISRPRRDAERLSSRAFAFFADPSLSSLRLVGLICFSFCIIGPST